MISEKIKERRIKAGLTQEALANALNVSPQAISKWERSVAVPDISMLVPIADYFGVSVDYLLRDESTETKIGNRFWEIKVSQPMKNMSAFSIKNLSPHFCEFLEYEIVLRDSNGDMFDYRRGTIYDFPAGYTKNEIVLIPGADRTLRSEVKITDCRIKQKQLIGGI